MHSNWYSAVQLCQYYLASGLDSILVYLITFFQLQNLNSNEQYITDTDV